MVRLLLCILHAQAAIVSGPPFNTTWFTSRAGSNLTVANNVLTWGLESTDRITTADTFHPLTKTTAEAVLTNLDKPVSLAAVGDEFAFTVNWLSTGTNKSKDTCPPSYYADGQYCLKQESESCVSHTPECLSGTGDFRIAFFDTASSKDAGQIKADNFAPTLDYNKMRTLMEKPPFVNWRGYNLHFFPHLSSKAKKYSPTDRGEAVPSSFDYRSNEGSSKEAWPFCNHKFGDPFGGFEIEENTWQELTFGVRRTGKTEFELSVSSNGFSNNQTHTWSSKDTDWIPQQVDCIGIIYPNERGYSHIQFK